MGGVHLAQLVKLQDYVSRYEKDLKRYTTQFVRLKKVQWIRMKSDWETGNIHGELEVDEAEEKPKKSFLPRFFRRKSKKTQDDEYIEDGTEAFFTKNEKELNGELAPNMHEEENAYTFQPSFYFAPQTMDDLKRMYIDQLFQFQMKWASSTLREESHLNPRYTRDTLLRAFTQRLPDSYLLLYRPVFQIKRAPVEAGIILLTPTQCLCIGVLEEEVQAAFIPDGSRFWTKKIGKIDKKILSPLIGLNRTESIVKQIFRENGIEMPIKKIVLSRNGYINDTNTSFGIEYIDKKTYPDWFSYLKKNSSPMKAMQLKAAQSLLQNVLTTSYNKIDPGEDAASQY